MRDKRPELNERYIDVEALDVNLEQMIRRIWEALLELRRIARDEDGLEDLYEAVAELTDAVDREGTHLSPQVAFQLGKFVAIVDTGIGEMTTDGLYLLVKKFFENDFSFDVRIFGLDEEIEFSKTLDELAKNVD